jgi:predicted DNA-binding transcriptional regulator AlpA
VTRWPRMMKARTAAEYCDLSESAFQGEVLAGRLPAPVMLGKREHWCQLALDRALAQLTGSDDLPEWEKEFQRRYG